MYYPDYVWMFFNWYSDNWWMLNSSCIMDGSAQIKDLEKVVKTSIVLDHYPRIEDEDVNKTNIGNIVSTLCK